MYKVIAQSTAVAHCTWTQKEPRQLPMPPRQLHVGGLLMLVIRSAQNLTSPYHSSPPRPTQFLKSAGRDQEGALIMMDNPVLPPQAVLVVVAVVAVPIPVLV